METLPEILYSIWLAVWLWLITIGLGLIGIIWIILIWEG